MSAHATPGRARAGAVARKGYYFGKPLVALLIIWELLAQSGMVSQQALPHVYEVADVFAGLAASGALLEPTQATLFRALSALCLSIILGVLIGLGMGRSKVINWFFDPIISVGFPLPKATLVPIYLLWFGFGTLPAILLATTAAVFPVIIATRQGVEGVDKELVWYARSTGVSRLAVTWKVILPGALPSIFNGVQLALFLSFVLTLVTEMVTSGGGLGANIVLAIRFFQTPEALSYLFVAVSMGVVTDRLFRRARAHLLRWQE